MPIASFVRSGERPSAPVSGDVFSGTSLANRALRLVGLAAALLRMWLGALLRAPRLAGETRGAFVHSSARRLLDALAVEVVVRGRPPDPRRPVLLVANHVSWLDSYAIHTVTDARFVAKSEIRAWPLIGTIAERFGTIFLVRGNRRDAWRTMKRAARALRAGDSVAAFPEGTTTGGDGMGRFYPALFQAAVDARVPVQPVAVRYYGADGEPTSAAAYIGDMSIRDSLANMVGERRLAVEVVFGAPLAPGADRRALCRAAEDAVRTALALPKHWLVELGAERKRLRFSVTGGGAAAAARA